MAQTEEDVVEARNAGIQRQAILWGSLVDDIRDIVPDLVHVNKNVILLLLTPCIETALSEPLVRVYHCRRLSSLCRRT